MSTSQDTQTQKQATPAGRARRPFTREKLQRLGRRMIGDRSNDVDQGFGWVKTLAAILGGVLTYLNAAAGNGGMIGTIGMTIGLLMVEAGLIYAGFALKHASCTSAQAPWLEGMVFAASLFIFVDFTLVIAREEGDKVSWFGYLVGLEAGTMLFLITKALMADERRQAAMYENGVHARTDYEQLQNSYGELVLEMDYARDQRDIKQKQRQLNKKRMLRRLRPWIFDSHGIRQTRDRALTTAADRINGQLIELLGLSPEERSERIQRLSSEIGGRKTAGNLPANGTTAPPGKPQNGRG